MTAKSLRHHAPASQVVKLKDHDTAGVQPTESEYTSDWDRTSREEILEDTLRSLDEDLSRVLK